MSSLGSIGGGGGSYDLGDNSSAAASGKSGDIYGAAKSVVFQAPGGAVNWALYVVLAVGAFVAYKQIKRGK